MSIPFRFHAASPRSTGHAALAAFTTNGGNMPHEAAVAAREPLFFFSGVT